MPKIVAALIVKNEAAVIRRCINSLFKAGVEQIVVNDNGSTDDTPKILEELGVIQVPGPWIDFSTNRNLVLSVARGWGDYVLCGIDADEELVVPDGWVWPEIAADLYSLQVSSKNLRYPRHALIKSTIPAAWKYAIHEILMLQNPLTTVEHLPGPHILVHHDGHRAADPNIQRKDLNVLLKAVVDFPDEPRYVFYAAQTFKDLGMFNHAATYYDHRLNMMDGYYQERWYSQYMLARIEEWSARNPLIEYLKAYNMNATRAEPLYHAADWLRRNNQPIAAYALASTFRKSQPGTGLFIEADIYEWRMDDIIAATAWWADEKQEGANASHRLLMNQRFTEDQRSRIEGNAKQYGIV